MSLGQNDNAILKLLADEQLRKENAALVAENERLRIAGEDILDSCFFEDAASERRARRGWEAAKRRDK